MRHLVLTFGLILLAASSRGQLYFMSDFYVHDALVINPAFAGSQGALSTTITHRNYWDGFEGSPRTISFTAHAPLNNERIGVGFFVLNDKIGVRKETSIVGNYAYRMNLANGTLSLGLGFGAIMSNTDLSNLAAYHPDDEILNNSASVFVMPDFSLGIYYSGGKNYIGISVPLFLSKNFNIEKSKYVIDNNWREYNYFLNAGRYIDIDQNIRLFPALLVKYHKGSGTQMDVGTQIIIKNFLWAGLTYRINNAMVGMLQCQINYQMRVGYAYNFVFAENLNYKYNPNEIMISYIFRYRVNMPGPR